MIKKEFRNRFLVCFGIIILLICTSINIDKFILNNYEDMIVKNTGIGFGLLKNQGTFIKVISLSIIIVVLSIFITILNKKELSKTNKLDLTGSALIITGSLSNLYERIFYGFVIDYVHNPIFPTFNLADSLITTGAVLIIIGMIFEKQINKL